MRIFLNRLHFPVTTLGPGRRIGIWLQGCSLRCAGCISVDTWAPLQGETSVEALVDSIRPWLAQADGVTISGGEPFEQPEALEALLRALRAALPPEADVLLYSGFAFEKIAPLLEAWAGLADALISEPFDAHAAQTLVWRGSDNQRLHLLSALGRERFGVWTQAPRTALPQALDVFFQDGEVWMAGIPAPGTMETLRTQLAHAGFECATSQARLPLLS